MNRKHDEVEPATLASLKTGNAAVDAEHATLFRLFQRLRQTTQGMNEPGGFHDVLGELGQEIFAHFEHEEAAFPDSGLSESDVQKHLRAHREIVHQYAELSLGLMNKNGIERDDVIALIHEWILHHLIQFDLKMQPAAAEAATL